MSDWLKEIIETVDREFDALPEWKKNMEEDDETRDCSSYDEDKPSTVIQEPRSY